MPKSRRMVLLGRSGGRRGGVARARSLTAAQRREIARHAARSRWRRPALVIDRAPRDHGELSAFVAHFGSHVSKGAPACRLEEVILRAAERSRRDSALARMLPVFLWRIRNVLDVDALITMAEARAQVRVVGYFLELAGALGHDRRLARSAARLRTKVSARRPEYLFEKTASNPFEAMLAEERTPPEARRWGLLTATPTDSFSSYFRKVRDL